MMLRRREEVEAVEWLPRFSLITQADNLTDILANTVSVVCNIILAGNLQEWKIYDRR